MTLDPRFCISVTIIYDNNYRPSELINIIGAGCYLTPSEVNLTGFAADEAVRLPQEPRNKDNENH